jgi:hypothetical protein
VLLLTPPHPCPNPQIVLQCGMRRVVPVQGLQLFMIHHSTNKAQVRRSKEDLLTTVSAA